MKKSRFIALALVVALMVMGAGYAYWTESVVVNNTIKTGELKVEFEPCSAAGETWGVHDYLIKPSVNSDKKTVTAKLENLYPNTDAFSVMRVKIVNNGTLAAKYDYSEVKANATGLMKRKINTEVTIKQSGHDDKRETGNLKNFKETIDTLLNGTRIEPGESVEFIIRYNLDASAPNSLERETAKPAITLNWKQFNQK